MRRDFYEKKKTITISGENGWRAGMAAMAEAKRQRIHAGSRAGSVHGAQWYKAGRKRGMRTMEKGQLLKRVYRYRIQLLMVIPCIAWYITFAYVPIISGVLLSFKDYKFNMGILRSPWVGLQYFQNFFMYYQTPQMIKNTLALGFMKAILEFPFAIILALMFNEVRRPAFKRITQTISYIPNFLSWVILATMMQRILAPNDGLLNGFLSLFGKNENTFWMMKESSFYPIIFLSDIWKGIGWGSIIYLAAITGIDPALYEAARIDGGNKWHEIIHVTLPGIRTTVGYLFILGIGGIVSSGYDQIYLMRTAGNMRLADTLDLYIIRIGLTGGQYGYGAAVGLIQGVVALVLVLTTNYLSKKMTEVSIW